jgi:hypothetical protein
MYGLLGLGPGITFYPTRITGSIAYQSHYTQVVLRVGMG